MNDSNAVKPRKRTKTMNHSNTTEPESFVIVIDGIPIVLRGSPDVGPYGSIYSEDGTLLTVAEQKARCEEAGLRSGSVARRNAEASE